MSTTFYERAKFVELSLKYISLTTSSIDKPIEVLGIFGKCSCKNIVILGPCATDKKVKYD